MNEASPPSTISTSQRFRRFAWIVIVSVATTIVATTAQAGNDDGILVGGQAALTAGALTAVTSDGAAAWYNPAGLARITRHSFDINASAYGISLIRADKMFTLPDGTSSDARVTDWQLIPSALSYSRVLGHRVVGSFGIFIPTTTDADLRASITETNGTKWSVGADQVRNEYDYIASLGIRISEALRVGVALHGIYISSENMTQVASGTQGAPQASFFTGWSHSTVGDYALRLGLGVQWTPRPQLELGLSLQTPALTGFRRTNRSVVETRSSGTSDGGLFVSEHQNELSMPWELSTPLVVRLGGALAVGRTQLLLDGSLSSPLDTSDRSLDRRLSGNLRAGVLTKLSERTSLGAGAFSDRNGFRERGANFVGVAGGVRFTSNYQISDGPRQLTFGTTLAGRYAYGWGVTDGLSFLSETDGRVISARLHVHELAFNLGGSVTF